MLNRTAFTSAVILILAAFICPAGLARDQVCSDDAGAKADELYAQSGFVFTKDRTPQTMLEAIKLIEQAVQICPDHEKSWALLCELYWQYGDALPKKTRDDKKVRIEWFTKGEAAGDKALAVNPDNVQALFFKTCNMGGGADMKGWSSSLWMFPTLKENMEIVDQKQPHYLYGGTARFWCEVLFRVPLFLAGQFGYTVEGRLQILEDEIKREPRYFSNYNYIAPLYWKTDEHDKALRYLKKVIEGDPNAFPEQAGVNRMEQRRARRYWKHFTGKDYPER